jgi:hypothetical protein
MQVVCEATQSPTPDVQVAAFGCLVKIMQLFYDKMRFYMERALFGVCISHALFICLIFILFFLLIQFSFSYETHNYTPLQANRSRNETFR